MGRSCYDPGSPPLVGYHATPHARVISILNIGLRAPAYFEETDAGAWLMAAQLIHRRRGAPDHEFSFTRAGLLEAADLYAVVKVDLSGIELWPDHEADCCWVSASVVPPERIILVS